MGLGMLFEMNQNDDMDVLSTFFAIVILTLCNAKMIMDEYTKKES
jgi:prenyltransferase beta subunit